MHLEVNGVSLLIDGAWQINRSLTRLLGGAAKRGSNEPMPYVDGRIAYKQWIDQSVFDLELLVRGKKNFAGATHADEIEGKFANLLYLRDNVAEVEAITMPGVLHMTTGNLTADVQVANWFVVDHGAVAVVTFDLIVPKGRFVAA